MSRWSDQFKQHPIHTTVSQLLEFLEVDLVEPVDSLQLEEIQRFRKILEMLASALKELDPSVTPFNRLDGITNHLKHQNCFAQATNYSKTRNIQHIVNANNHVSAILDQISWLVSFTKESAVTGLINSVESTLNQTTSTLMTQKKEVTERVNSLKHEITELEEEQATLSSLIETRRQEVDQQISTWQQQFSEAQDKRSSDYSSWKNDLDKDIKNTANKITSSAQNDVNQYKINITTTLEDIKSDAQEKHNSILELYELASGDSISGGYAQTANQEKNQSNFWRGISYLFIVLAVIWLFIAYQNSDVSAKPEIKTTSITSEQIRDENKASQTSSNNPASELKTELKLTAQPDHISSVTTLTTWQHFLLSFSLTGVLLFGAGYAARQAHSHRETEQKTRWFALQVKALDPYISSMNPEDQKALKRELAEKFFNGVDHSSNKNLDLEPSTGLIDSITNLAKQFKE